MLGVERVGVEDASLEPGGDSVAAMQILSRVRKALRVELSPRDLFEYPTVALMTELIDSAQKQTGVQEAEGLGL